MNTVGWSRGVPTAAALGLAVGLSVSRRQAYTDPLTGLPNRSRLIGWSRSRKTRSMCLALLDLDRFSEVNNQYGHLVGDELLATVAVRLRETAQAVNGLAFRLGGDEFVVTAPGDHVDHFADSLVDVLAEPYRLEDHTLSIGASIGLVVTQPGWLLTSALRDADAAMYRAKNTNTV